MPARVASRDALTLREVCRAGFCRPRHAVGLVHRAAFSLFPRPETWSRSGFPPEEVCKPDSVLPPRKREQQPFVWSPGCPGDRATDPRERTGSPRLASRPEPPSYTVLLRVGFTERPLSRADLVSSYLTVSPLLRARRRGAVSFLWHFPPIARGRR